MSKQKVYLIPESESMPLNTAAAIFMEYYYTNEAFDEIRTAFRAKDKVLDNKVFSSRIINHWEKEGLISGLRPSGIGWRKYSLMDRFWLEVISELRKFGYPLERIKALKNNLVGAETDSVSCMPHLEVFFVLAAYFKEPCYLLVYPDDEAMLAIVDERNLLVGIYETTSFICINLNFLIQRMFPNEDCAAKFNPEVILSPEEVAVLDFVNRENFESITVKLKNGKINLIEATETLNADTRVTDIIKGQDHQNIEIKTSGGRPVAVKRTINKRF